MPSKEEREQTRRSWRTRMDSVIRQFNQLAREGEEGVTDEDSGNLVKIIGMALVCGKTRITVLPLDVPESMYSVDVEVLRL